MVHDVIVDCCLKIYPVLADIFFNPRRTNSVLSLIECQCKTGRVVTVASSNVNQQVRKL